MKKIILLFFVFSGQLFSQKVILKSGDILFQSLNCGSLCDAINRVTSGYKGNDFNHIGLVIKEKDSLFVMEAAETSVKKTPLALFKSYTTNTIFVGRLKPKYRKLIPQAIAFSLQQIGVEYDHEYRYNNQKYYCSELIYDAFLFANKKPFFQLYPMTFKEPNSQDFFKVWEAYYQNLDTTIPEGELGCNPGGISISNKLKIIGTLD